MAAASIVSDNVWERFHECWHERFNVYMYSVNFLQVHEPRFDKLRMVRIYRLDIIGRDVFMLCHHTNRVSPTIVGNYLSDFQHFTFYQTLFCAQSTLEFCNDAPTIR